MGRENHPVWGVYDLWRTAKLNVKYYSHILNSIQNTNLFVEVILAASTSSALAALWLWETNIGGIAWKVLLGVAAVLSILKPLLRFPTKIKLMEPALSGYRLLEHDCEDLINKITQSKAYNNEHVEQFNEIFNRKRVLIKDSPIIKEKKRIKRKYEQEIEENLEDYNYFIPEE